MAVPTNPAEAATGRIRNVLIHWHNIRDKQADSNTLQDRGTWITYFDYDEYQLERIGRFKTLNGQAHRVVEDCLKILILLHCDTTPGHLYTHDTEQLTAELARHAPDQAARTEQLRGDISHEDISSWYQRANYEDADIVFDQPASRAHTASLLLLAAAYTQHAVSVYESHAGDQADGTAIQSVVRQVEAVEELLGYRGEGLDPPDLPGDKEPHPEEIEQLKTEQFLAQQRAAELDPLGSDLGQP